MGVIGLLLSSGKRRWAAAFALVLSAAYWCVVIGVGNAGLDSLRSFGR